MVHPNRHIPAHKARLEAAAKPVKKLRKPRVKPVSATPGGRKAVVDQLKADSE